MRKGIALALLAAALYALNAPLSKLLLTSVPPTIMAGLLYIGAGVGMVFIALFRRLRGKQGREMRLTRRELPWTAAMILLDIAAPVCLMLGLKSASAAAASLLNNFEIVATAIIALVIFKESVSPRLWAGILFTVVSCAILSVEDAANLRFSAGSLLILLACVCWGFENNCTRRLSNKDPMQIVLLKGIFSGTGSVIIGLLCGEKMPSFALILPVLAVGFVAYGLSIYFYVYAQRLLGAARTSAYYAVSPFIGALLSLIIFREVPQASYLAALGIMIVGAWLCSSDAPVFRRKK